MADKPSSPAALSAASSSSSAASTSGPSTPRDTNDQDTAHDAHFSLVSNDALGTSLREAPAPDLLQSRQTLAEFRQQEGPSVRSAKLRQMWSTLPRLPSVDPEKPTEAQRMRLPGQDTPTALSPERAERLRTLYQEELVKRCGENRPDALLWGGADDLLPGEGEEVREKGVSWKSFRKYLWDQERQLWDMFQELDRNGDGVLDVDEIGMALNRAGADLSPTIVRDLVHFLAGSTKGSAVSFQEFRDFLLMLPRRATPLEIYKFYQVHKRFSDGRGAARVNMDGDPNPSFPKAPGDPEHSTAEGFLHPQPRHDQMPANDDFDDIMDLDEDEEYNAEFHKHDAWRFLLAGGIAGGVSRSVTAPFDRLKVYLITSTAHPEAGKPSPFRALRNLGSAVRLIYNEGGGVRAFWVGNGLNVAKILPESAIKFVSYEQSKRFFAKYWDKVTDPADISSSSRFIAGGIGGITSQLSIYGLETLKTRVQSELGPSRGWQQVVTTMRVMWRQGGLMSYYRGLTLGLVGVFPYSAIDMGTYETLKTTYCKSMNVDEPPVYAVLCFGALSGSIGAATVYREFCTASHPLTCSYQSAPYATASIWKYRPPAEVHRLQGRSDDHAEE